MRCVVVRCVAWACRDQGAESGFLAQKRANEVSIILTMVSGRASPKRLETPTFAQLRP